MRRRLPSGRVGLQFSQLNCDALADLEPRAVGLTYWFDTDTWTEPASVEVTFHARPAGRAGPVAPSDVVSRTERLPFIPPGVGRVAVTTRITPVTAEAWTATAEGFVEPRQVPRPLPGACWRLPVASASGESAFAPVLRVRAPGARLGVWPALVLTGFFVALVLQAWLASRSHLPSTRLLMVTLAAGVVGLLSSKVYHRLLHRQERSGLLTTGMGIQGFVLGAMVTLAAGASVARLPLLAVLDVSAAPLLVGMAIGRYGCFFGGCCAGRPSRRGLWSSDRRLGVRRIPVQLFESCVALSVALLLVVLLLAIKPTPAGVIFVGGLAGYTLARQLLFPLRDIRRQTAHGRRVMIGLCSLLLVGAVGVGLVA